MSKLCGIYGIHNLYDRRWYIGQSTDIKLRLIHQFSNLRGNRNSNRCLQAAFSHYGQGMFESYILEEVPESMLSICEVAWVAYYKSNQRTSGYNLTSGGLSGTHVAESSCLKMAKSQRGRKHSLAARRKMSKSAKGVVRSEAWLQKIRRANLGKHHSWKTKQHLSKVLTGRTMSKVTKIRMSIARQKYWDRKRQKDIQV